MMHNVLVGVSAGDAKNRHFLSVIERHQAQPTYRITDNTTLTPETSYVDMAAEAWGALRKFDDNGIHPAIVVDVTVGGKQARDALQHHRNAIPNVPVIPMHVSGAATGGTAGGIGRNVGRKALVANVASALSASHLWASRDLLRELGKFEYDPTRHRLASGEDAWRIDDHDGTGLAVGICMTFWEHFIPHDIQTTATLPPEYRDEPHPPCQGPGCCLHCPECLRKWGPTSATPADYAATVFVNGTCSWCTSGAGGEHWKPQARIHRRPWWLGGKR